MQFQYLTVKKQIDEEGDALDAEFSKIAVSYTSGGMTVNSTSRESKDAASWNSCKLEDKDYWSLGLSFAF